MTDPSKPGSAQAGSPSGPAINPTPGTGAGQPGQQMGNVTVDKVQYDELFSKFGSQGKELGEYRQFFQNIAPLLDKLDQNPELVQGIIDGKIDKDLAKAIYEGRINVSDAQAVQQAHEQIKTEVGKEAYQSMTPAQVEKLVEAKADQIRKELSDKADFDAFQSSTQKFIESTSDFAEYADEIDKWLDKHEVTDVSVAYYAVKGQLSEAAAKKAAEAAEGERAKDFVMNAQGGGVTAQFSSDGVALVDRLIAGRPNGNNL